MTEVEEKLEPLDDAENFIGNKYGHCFYDIKEGLIYNLFVEPPYRNQGHGRRLLSKILNLLYREGFQEGEIKIQCKPMENSIDYNRLKKFYKILNLKIIE